jgi:hypothetical protein
MNILKLQKRNISHKNNNYNLNENDEDDLLNESNQINNEFLENELNSIRQYDNKANYKYNLNNNVERTINVKNIYTNKNAVEIINLDNFEENMDIFLNQYLENENQGEEDNGEFFFDDDIYN